MKKRTSGNRAPENPPKKEIRRKAASKKAVAKKQPKAKKPAAAAKLAARNQRIAEAIIEGETITAIAEREQLSRSWASQLANSSPVGQIITSLVNSVPQRIHALFLRSLDSIEAAFDAKATAQFQGCLVVLGPDHYARLAAAKRFAEFITLGRPAPKDDSKQEKSITLADIKRLLEEQQETLH